MAIRGAKNSFSTSSVSASAPSFITTHAIGRSIHFLECTAMIAASATSGWSMISFSTWTEGIHSPPVLIKSFVRSTSFTYLGRDRRVRGKAEKRWGVGGGGRA